MNATIRLFKALEVDSNKKPVKPTKEFLQLTLKYGVIFTPNVLNDYSLNTLVDIARDVGISFNEMNSSFHKSWEKVKNSPLEQLFMEQIIHYFTTYGLENLNAYSKDTIFIPAEKLDTVKNQVEFIVIKGMTKTQLKERLLVLLESGVALEQQTVDDCVELCEELKINTLERINNKEVRVALGIKLGLVPSDPIEFLRLLIYKSTKKTLLIKSPVTIKAIKEVKDEDCIKLMKMYDKKYGLEQLSQIFYRFKPLFLAFKYTKQANTMINQIRKLAVINHKPMKEDYLNNITSSKNTVNTKKLKEELEKANIFRKARLAYALKFRMKEDNTSIMYRIRNGKSYSTSFETKNVAYLQPTYNTVVESIINDLTKQVKGKKIYIPSYITYSLPSSEKMFTGEIPSGSYITIDKNIVFGVHWNDIKDTRIDLDLSMSSVEGKIGWDRSYRSENSGILFSGDMTAAPLPNGATELFYVQKQGKITNLVNLNYFNYDDGTEVPYQIVIGKETIHNLHSNYMINPNNILCMVNSKINQKQKILGLLISTTQENRFYFCETYMGNTITTYNEKEYVKQSREYLFNYYQNTINLNELLIKAGAKLVDNVDKCDIDLSPSALSKDTIINLMTSQK